METLRPGARGGTMPDLRLWTREPWTFTGSSSNEKPEELQTDSLLPMAGRGYPIRFSDEKYAGK
jgi:hypothetical protein